MKGSRVQISDSARKRLPGIPAAAFRFIRTKRTSGQRPFRACLIKNEAENVRRLHVHITDGFIVRHSYSSGSGYLLPDASPAFRRSFTPEAEGDVSIPGLSGTRYTTCDGAPFWKPMRPLHTAFHVALAGVVSRDACCFALFNAPRRTSGLRVDRRVGKDGPGQERALLRGPFLTGLFTAGGQRPVFIQNEGLALLRVLKSPPPRGSLQRG